MQKEPTIWDFLEENKKSLNEYIELRIQIFSLQFTRKVSTIAGLIIWILILLACFFVFLSFACVTIGFWLSSIFGSYIVGFGYTTGIIVIITLLLFLGRKQLFINPIIRLIIKEQTSNHEQA